MELKMENRLCLNKKIRYELPDEVLIGVYEKRNPPRRDIIPDFSPDICLNVWGKIGEIEEKYKTKTQIWIKSKNKELLEFIENKDFKDGKNYFIAPVLSVNTFKRVLLEEFYGVKYGE